MRIEQLIGDPGFTQWALNRDTRAAEQWNTYYSKHPEHQAMMEEARLLITGIEIEKDSLPQQTIHKEWDRLEKTLRPKQVTKSNQRRVIQIAGAIAASIAVFLALWWALGPSTDEVPMLEINTGNGEIKMVTLIDSSQVWLNANSTLQFPGQWGGKTRDVILEGEAFFVVNKDPDGKTFHVRSGDIEVEVLGTEFNVSHRDANAEVSLVEGKVNVMVDNQNKEVALDPGEIVRYTPNDQSLRIVKSDIYSRISWKDHVWVFENTSLEEILGRISIDFGIETRVSDSTLLSRTISGRVSTQELTTLLKALEELLSLEMIQKKDTLIVKNNK